MFSRFPPDLLGYIINYLPVSTRITLNIVSIHAQEGVSRSDWSSVCLALLSKKDRDRVIPSHLFGMRLCGSPWPINLYIKYAVDLYLNRISYHQFVGELTGGTSPYHWQQYFKQYVEPCAQCKSQNNMHEPFPFAHNAVVSTKFAPSEFSEVSESLYIEYHKRLSAIAWIKRHPKSWKIKRDETGAINSIRGDQRKICNPVPTEDETADVIATLESELAGPPMEMQSLTFSVYQGAIGVSHFSYQEYVNRHGVMTVMKHNGLQESSHTFVNQPLLLPFRSTYFLPLTDIGISDLYLPPFPPTKLLSKFNWMNSEDMAFVEKVSERLVRRDGCVPCVPAIIVVGSVGTSIGTMYSIEDPLTGEKIMNYDEM